MVQLFRSRLPLSAVGGVSMMLLVSGCGSPEQRAQGYYEKGMELIAKRDDLNARLELLKAVKYKSDKIEIWRALAGVDERTRADQALFQDLRRIVELDPNDLDARLNMSRIMVSAGAADAALKVVEAANEGDKPSAPLHALKGAILARLNDIPGAMREAQRALEIDPKNVEAILLISAKKAVDGDGAEALRLLSLVPAGDKSEKQVLSQKVQIYARMGDLRRAEDLQRKLVADHPDEPAFQGQLIQLLIASKRFDEAEKEIRVRATASKDTKASIELVKFIISTRGVAAGRQELSTLIKAGGDVYDYKIMQAELDAAEGKVTEAIAQLQDVAASETVPARKTAAQSKIAEIYVSKSNFGAAEPIIAQILEKDRANTSALRLRATIRISQNQFDSAIADLREALNNEPKSVDLLLLMASAYERSGKLELADRQFADALKAPVPNPSVALGYVGFLQRRGDIARSEDVLIEAIGRTPNNVQLLSTLAQIRLSRQNWVGALAVADTIAKTNDGSGLSDQVRAAALAGQNKIDDSITALEAAHAAAPNAVQPVAALTSSYIRVGKPDKAEALLRDMLNKFPDNASLFVLMGRTRAAQNKTDDALKNYKTAISKQPADMGGYSALSELYVTQKNFPAAIEVVQAALKEQPSNVNLRLTSAGLQIMKGDQAAAISEYETILKDQPNSLVAINNLASLILDSRTDKESIDRAAAMSEKLKASAVPQFEDTYGWSQYKRGDYKGAVATLEAAKSKMKDLSALRYHLGMSYASDGQPDKAAEEFKAALALEPDGTPLKASIRAAMK